MTITARKVSKYGLNTGRYGPEKTPYLDTFHAVTILTIEIMISVKIEKYNNNYQR